VPQALAAMLMKLFSPQLLRRFGHKTVLVVNTVLLGVTIGTFALVSSGTPIWALLLVSFSQGFFSPLQFSSMNTLTYADVSDDDASKASSLSSTARQMSLSFGVAFALRPGGNLSGPCRSTSGGPGDARASQGLSGHGAVDDRFICYVLEFAAR
jgi:MFS family permease